MIIKKVILAILALILMIVILIFIRQEENLDKEKESTLQNMTIQNQSIESIPIQRDWLRFSVPSDWEKHLVVESEAPYVSISLRDSNKNQEKFLLLQRLSATDFQEITKDPYQEKPTVIMMQNGVYLVNWDLDGGWNMYPPQKEKRKQQVLDHPEYQRIHLIVESLQRQLQSTALF